MSTFFLLAALLFFLPSVALGEGWSAPEPDPDPLVAPPGDPYIDEIIPGIESTEYCSDPAGCVPGAVYYDPDSGQYYRYEPPYGDAVPPDPGTSCTPTTETCGACAEVFGSGGSTGQFQQTCNDGCSNYTKNCVPTLTFTGTYGSTTGQNLTIPQAGNVTLNWSTTNINPSFGKCSATNGWSGDKLVNGSETIRVSVNTVFTLSCVNDSTPRTVSWWASTGPKSVTVNIGSTCGDGVCNGSETCSTCSTDCGVCPPPACIPDCSKANQVCTGKTFNDANGCGTNNCAGTRSCDYNWKEVNP